MTDKELAFLLSAHIPDMLKNGFLLSTGRGDFRVTGNTAKIIIAQIKKQADRELLRRQKMDIAAP